MGSPGTSGLLVEQRKRLTIAVELVANPAVVFMGACFPELLFFLHVYVWYMHSFPEMPPQV